MTLLELATINCLKKIAGEVNHGDTSPQFVRELTRVVDSDAKIKAYVSRSIADELAVLQFDHNPKNACFNGLFDFLVKQPPSGKPVEVFRSVLEPKEAPPQFFPDVIGQDRGKAVGDCDMLACLRS